MEKTLNAVTAIVDDNVIETVVYKSDKERDELVRRFIEDYFNMDDELDGQSVDEIVENTHGRFDNGQVMTTEVTA
jgi:hypothetical protein